MMNYVQIEGGPEHMKYFAGSIPNPGNRGIIDIGTPVAGIYYRPGEIIIVGRGGKDAPSGRKYMYERLENGSLVITYYHGEEEPVLPEIRSAE